MEVNNLFIFHFFVFNLMSASCPGRSRREGLRRRSNGREREIYIEQESEIETVVLTLYILSSDVVVIFSSGGIGGRREFDEQVDNEQFLSLL